MRPKQNRIRTSLISVRALNRLALVICFTLLATTRPASADTVINFDDVPNGTEVNTQYSGVTIKCTAFSCEPADAVYAVATANAFSGPNALISTGEGLDAPGILFIFDVPQSVVTIEGSTDQDFNLSMAIYLAIGTPIGAASGHITPSSGPYSLLSASTSSGGIDAIAVGADGPNLEAIGTSYFDNLCFSTSITGCGNQVSTGAVGAPEPPSSALLALALALLMVLVPHRRAA